MSDFVRGLKEAADLAGNVNKFSLITLLNTDFQHLNNFGITFYPTEWSASSMVNSTVDNALTKLFVKGVEGIELPTIDYIDINGIKHVVGITPPTSVTFTFIEPELGTVRGFLKRWMEQIYKPCSPSSGKPFSGGLNDINSDKNSYYYVFNSNQRGAKKNAMIMLTGSLGLPSLGGWILLEGLAPISGSGFDFEQESEDILEISIQMSVDTIKFVSPISALPIASF